MNRKIIKRAALIHSKMEIKNNIQESLIHYAERDKLLPKLNNFDNHFLLAHELEFLKTPSMELLNQAEKSWKEIENFEFQKMDVKASFEQLIKRI